MRPSPLQLQHVIYNKISVLPFAKEGERPPRAIGFDFEGVSIRAQISTGIKEGQGDDPRDFVVTLNVTLDNNEGKPAPYNVDVGVIGVFKVLPSLPKEKREDLVTVNGASILYGAIREIVLSLTSRFAAGGLTLPGMNFEDDVPSKQSSNTATRTSTAEKSRVLKPTRKSRQKT